MNAQTDEATEVQTHSDNLTRRILSKVGRDSTDLREQKKAARSMRRAMDEIKAGISQAARAFYSDEERGELEEHFTQPSDFTSEQPLSEQLYRYFYRQEFDSLMNWDDIDELQEKARHVHEAIYDELQRLNIQVD